MKKHLWTIWYGLVLLGFTVYLALDTFVLSSAYQTDATDMNMAMFENVKEISSAGDDVTALAQTENSEGTADAQTENSVLKADAETKNNAAAAEDAKTENQVTVTEDTQTSRSKPGRSGRRPGSSSSGSGSRSGFAASSSGDLTADSVISFGMDALEDTSYQNDNISVSLTEYYEYDTHIYVADVTVTSAEYLKTAFAEDTYGKNVTETTSQIAEAHGAILAVNGDYYGVQESGYVIRNGIVYRDRGNGSDLLCVYADGRMEIIDSDDYTAQELVEMGVWQALCFGPGLVEDGQVTVLEDQEVGKSMASNPRTAVGMIEEGHYIFVVSDGRTEDSEGLSLYELAQFMQKLGVQIAYNLDGGGSSTMYFNGQVVNNPTTNGRIKERGVSDIVYIG